MTQPADLDERDLTGVSLVWATWALFVGLTLLLIGVGLFGTVLGVRAEAAGSSDLALGVLGASYYGGFLAGAAITVRALTRVGHIRVYAALASLLAASMLSTGMTENEWLWTALRFASGVCIAGLYVVAESWLNQLSDNATRGRLLGAYLVVTGGAFGVGQLLVGSFDPRTVTAFVVAAILTSAAVTPVALSEDAAPPPVERGAHIELRKLARAVPTGVGTCFLVGISHGALVAMGAIYATRSGLSPAEAGRFVAITAVGAVLAQWPISAASDELDRRYVGVIVAIGAVGASFWLLVSGPDGWVGLAAMTALGGLSYPLYSIASAYTNDWVEPEHLAGAASQLVFLYGAGAFVGPLLAALAIAVVGIDGFPWTMVGLHAAIAAFLVYRIFAWRAPLARVSWAESSYSTRVFFIPANVVWMSRRLSERARR